MAVKSYDYSETGRRRPPQFPVNRVLAALAWLLGCGATYSIVGVLLGNDAPWYIAASTAAIVQALLTACEWRMFVQGKRSEAAIIALGADVICNAAGLYFPMTRIGDSPIGAMLADMTGAAPTVGKIVAAVLAIIFGYLLARAPEFIWQAE